MRLIHVRTSLCLLLVACGSAAGPETGWLQPPTKSARTPEKISPGLRITASPGLRITASPGLRTTATHGSAVTRLALTDDGTAALSADQHGGIRLWPALDGSREPFVVSGAEPDALSIARDGDGFVIADHDAAHGVELIRLAATGEVRGRATLDPDPEILQVELTAAGALVLRADRSIELLDATGVSRSRLVTEPGTRARSILVRAGRALAIVDEGAAVRARWIQLEGGRASWGETTVRLPIDAGRPIALSPDHTRVVAMKPGPIRAPVLVDLATGTIAKRPMCATIEAGTQEVAAQQRLANPFDDLVAQDVVALGFLDATTVACSAATQVVWWSTAGDQIIPKRADPIVTSGVELAIGGGVLVGGLGHQLGMYTPDSQKFLGYGFRELTNVRVTASGVMIGKGDQQPLLLDTKLRERARFALPKQNSDWTDLYPLDERYVLTVSTRPMSVDAWGSAYQVAVFDAAKRTVHQLLPNHAASSELSFEPATQLLLSSDGITHLLLRFDPLTHSFVERIEIVSKPILKRVYLLDPALSDGVIAIGVHDDDGGFVVDEFHADDLRGGTLAARASHRLRGKLDAIDRTGQVFVAAEDRAVYRHGIRGTAQPELIGMMLRPSNDGTHLAAIGGGRIALVSTATGRMLWQTAAWGATDVMWLPNGELAARFPGALAKLDLSTGELAERQCGWAFGLSETPFETSASTPIVCDVAR